MIKKNLLSMIPFIGALLLLTGCMSNSIMSVYDRQVMEFPELVDKIKEYRLVFVGEMHDAKWTHRAELKVISGLKDSGARVAVGMEMFKTESQSDLDRWVEGKMSEDEFVKVYRNNWGIPWRQYREIFLYARDNRIPIVALNISRKIIHRVFTGGFKSLTQEELKELGDIECKVDRSYEEFIREAMQEHEMKDATFQKFCEAQMVWDATMARNSVEYLEKNQGTTLVVMAGSGHSWKRGIPTQVKKRSDVRFVVILPEAEDTPSRDNVTTKDADYLWLR